MRKIQFASHPPSPPSMAPPHATRLGRIIVGFGYIGAFALGLAACEPGPLEDWSPPVDENNIGTAAQALAVAETCSTRDDGNVCYKMRNFCSCRQKDTGVHWSGLVDGECSDTCGDAAEVLHDSSAVIGSYRYTPPDGPTVEDALPKRYLCSCQNDGLPENTDSPLLKYKFRTSLVEDAAECDATCQGEWHPVDWWSGEASSDKYICRCDSDRWVSRSLTALMSNEESCNTTCRASTPERGWSKNEAASGYPPSY